MPVISLQIELTHEFSYLNKYKLHILQWWFESGLLSVCFYEKEYLHVYVLSSFLADLNQYLV